MIGSLARSLERFLLPNACVACEGAVPAATPDALVCSVCTSRLEAVPSGCPRCQQPTPPVGPCRFCNGWPSRLSSVRSAVWLGAEARALVHHLKYEGYSALGREVARIIDRTVGRRPATALVPVPLAQRRKRDRGYNQASVIARELARRWRVPVLERLVRRTRDTESQTALSPHDRHENVAGAFLAAAPPSSKGHEGQRGQGGPGGPIILIDDVLTTGATVVAVAEALQAAGWQTVEAITFARALPYARRVIAA